MMGFREWLSSVRNYLLWYIYFVLHHINEHTILKIELPFWVTSWWLGNDVET